MRPKDEWTCLAVIPRAIPAARAVVGNAPAQVTEFQARITSRSAGAGAGSAVLY